VLPPKLARVDKRESCPLLAAGELAQLADGGSKLDVERVLVGFVPRT
jgi:hypothetical protein